MRYTDTRLHTANSEITLITIYKLNYRKAFIKFWVLHNLFFERGFYSLFYSHNIASGEISYLMISQNEQKVNVFSQQIAHKPLFLSISSK
jgi:hypothetical protein